MKRILVLFCSISLLIMLLPLMFFISVLSTISTISNGFFIQSRIGQHAKPFTIYKFRTMKNGRVNKVGKFLRKTKLDELPQLFNILKGDMTFVGPRPDVPGYYDLLKGNDRKVLQLKPGLTSPAALKYRNEETLLQKQENPLQYNDRVIFPDKVRMNLEYLENRSVLLDLKILWYTLIGVNPY